MDLKTRRAQAEKRLADLRANVTPEALAERTERAEILRLESEADEEERAQARDRLDARVEAYKAKNPGAKVEGLMIESFPDTFVIERNGRAHAQWTEQAQRMAQAGATGRKHTGDDRNTNNRKYAVQCVVNWNGADLDEKSAELSLRLHQYLTENPGIVTAITDVAARLTGVYSEERSKSG